MSQTASGVDVTTHVGSNHVEDSLATHTCVVRIETPDSRTQVYMSDGGELAVHDNVVFEANAAVWGGAVSLRFNSIAHPSGDVCFDRFCDDWFDSPMELTMPRRKG